MLAAIMEITNCVEQRGLTEIDANAQSTLAPIDRNEDSSK